MQKKRDKLIIKKSQESFKFLNTCFDNHAIPVYCAMPDGKIIYANPSSSLMTGYSIKYILTRKIDDLIMNEKSINRNTFFRRLKKNKEIIIDAKYRLKKGKDYDIRRVSSIINVNEKKYEIIYVLLNAQKNKIFSDKNDIEDKFRFIDETMPYAMFLVDKKGVFKYANRVFVDSFGGVIINKSMYDLFPKKIAAQQISLVNKVLKSKKYAVFECNSFVAGKEKLYEIHAKPLKNDKGKYDSVMSIAIDISERIKLENSLKERHKYESALSKISGILLGSKKIKNAINLTLKELLKVSGTDRVYIFENSKDNKGNLVMEYKYEVVKRNVSIEINNPEVSIVPYSDGFMRWRKNLSKGIPIIGQVKDFPKGERELLEIQDIRSLLVIPIFVEKEWYGFIGFDSVDADKMWKRYDIQLLKASSEMIGSYISTVNSKMKIKEAVNIIDNSPIVSFIWKADDGWTIDYASLGVKKLLGYSARELIKGKVSYENFLYKEDVERIEKEMNFYVKQKKMVQFSQQYRVVAKNGKVKWVEDKTFVKTDKNGNITHFQGIVYDISKEKRQKEELAQRLEYERFLSYISNRFLNFKDEDIKNLIVDSIKELCKLLKLDILLIYRFDEERKKAIMRYGWSVMQNFKIEAYEMNFSIARDMPFFGQRLLKGEEIVFSGLDAFPKNAKVESKLMKKWDAGSFAVIPNIYNEQVIGFSLTGLYGKEREWTDSELEVLRVAVGIFSSAIEQKKTERELKDSEKKFRMYVDNSPMAAFVLNNKWEFKYLNKQVKNLLGIKIETLLNINFLDLVNGCDKEKINKALRELDYRKRIKDELYLKHISGKGVPVVFTAIKLRDDEIIALCEDITEKKESENKIMEQIDMLKRFKESTVDQVIELQRIEEENKMLKKKIAAIKRNQDKKVEIS